MNHIIKQTHRLIFRLTDAPTAGERNFLHDQIKQYNNTVSPQHRAARKIGAIEPLAIVIQDVAGQIVGGVAGDTYWGWLEIDDFWLAQSLRGQGWGRDLLHAIEIEAMLRGCTRAFLKTYSFQASGFYEKMSYRVVGELTDYPPGETLYWMRKDFGRPNEHVSFKNVRSEADVLAYLAQINRNHPERPQVIRHIEEQLQARPDAPLPLVELCCGPGMLARQLLDRLPEIRYLGFDFSPAFVAFTGRQLAPFGRRAEVQRADLNADGWLSQVPAGLHAIVSLQSLHDLGDESHVDRIYRLAHRLLAPGGLLLNADLIVPEGQSRPDNPGRLSVSHHLALLREHGFQGVACTLRLADFACVVGYKP